MTIYIEIYCIFAFVMEPSFSTPILLLIFNRPNAVHALVDNLRILQPTVLYIGADGPRANKTGEKEKCAQSRSIIDQIDWPCRIEKLYQEENLGCRNAVHQAITWFFEQEEQGIILEDDCIADESFFHYCAELLTRYKHLPQIMHIAGDNPINKGTLDQKESYTFVQMPLVWGWATWREAWQKMNLSLAGLEQFNFEDLPYSKLAQKYLKAKFYATQNGENDSWAYAWYFSILQANGLCAIPKINLVRNIGFGADSTHTQTHSKVRELQSQVLGFPLHHPTIPAKPNVKREQSLFYAAQKSKMGLWGRAFLPTWLRRLLGAHTTEGSI